MWMEKCIEKRNETIEMTIIVYLKYGCVWKNKLILFNQRKDGDTCGFKTHILDVTIKEENPEKLLCIILLWQ